MKPYTAVVSIRDRNKITIPRDICEVMKLKPGEIIEITIARIEEEAA